MRCMHELSPAFAHHAGPDARMRNGKGARDLRQGRVYDVGAYAHLFPGMREHHGPQKVSLPHELHVELGLVRTC